MMKAYDFIGIFVTIFSFYGQIQYNHGARPAEGLSEGNYLVVSHKVRGSSMGGWVWLVGGNKSTYSGENGVCTGQVGRLGWEMRGKIRHM
jgi:hypothetical protein